MTEQTSSQTISAPPASPVTLSLLNRKLSAGYRHYIALDLTTGRLRHTSMPLSETGTPGEVYNGFDRRWAIGAALPMREINRLLREIVPLAEQMVAGAYRGLDGFSNRVMKLDDNASRACQHITALVENYEDDQISREMERQMRNAR